MQERRRGTYGSDMCVNGADSLVGAGLQQLGCDHLLDGEDDAILASDTNGRAAILNSLDCIFYLKVAAIRRED